MMFWVPQGGATTERNVFQVEGRTTHDYLEAECVWEKCRPEEATKISLGNKRTVVERQSEGQAWAELWSSGKSVVITTSDDILSKAESLVLMDLVMSTIKLNRKEHFRT